MDAEQKIYRAFRESKEGKLYFNQIKDITGLSNSSLQNALASLVQDRLLIKEVTKANAFYAIADKKAAALEFAKIDLHRLESLNRNTRIPLKELTESAPREIATIILFGSASRKLETEKSDIDVLIIMHDFEDKNLQKKYEKEMKRKIEIITKDIQSRSIHPINTIFTTTDAIKMPKDHLINQAITTGFPILNQQHYHELMSNEHSPTLRG